MLLVLELLFTLYRGILTVRMPPPVTLAVVLVASANEPVEDALVVRPMYELVVPVELMVAAAEPDVTFPSITMFPYWLPPPVLIVPPPSVIESPRTFDARARKAEQAVDDPFRVDVGLALPVVLLLRSNTIAAPEPIVTVCRRRSCPMELLAVVEAAEVIPSKVPPETVTLPGKRVVSVGQLQAAAGDRESPEPLKPPE